MRKLKFRDLIQLISTGERFDSASPDSESPDSKTPERESWKEQVL